MLIIADDLTGAADCGAACARQGRSVFVVMDGSAPPDDADVVAVDADTRSLDATAAGARIRQLVDRFAASPLLFKKVDSTLRGHVGSELAAALAGRRDATGQPVTAVFASAFPATGRTIVEGRPYLHGIPLEQTEVWRHERRGAGVFLPDLMAAAGLTAALIDLAQVRGPTLPDRMARLCGTVDVLVFDAETDADLAAITAAATSMAGETIWAGSAGLVSHVAGTRSPINATMPRPPVRPGPLLFVVGSMSSVSRRQADVLAQAPGMMRLDLAVSEVVASADGRPVMERTAQLERMLLGGSDVVITLTADIPDDPAHALPLRLGLAALAEPVAAQIGGLLVTGGETGRAVLNAMGVAGLHLQRELEPGVPLCIAPAPHRFGVVTKAGAFGDERTLLNCRQALRDLAGSFPLPSSSSDME